MDQQNRSQILNAVRVEIGKLPFGTTSAEIQRARDVTAERFVGAHETTKKKRKLIDEGLAAVYPSLIELSKEFDFDTPLRVVAAELQEPIRVKLGTILSGNESTDELKRIVHRLVKKLT